MCGIAGIIRFNTSLIEKSDLKRMTDVISHRGPDGDGHWINQKGNVGFGHRRLSIIDLSDSGHQPMHYADKRYTITFNGEIYNYIELRDSLVNKGYTFKSNSDTEVLMALYDLKKEKCLDDLDGMFSFAIWDEKENILFCARDRFGEKPFHYYKDENQFVFASEIKQFWEIEIEKRIDQEMLQGFVKMGTLQPDDDLTKTYFKTIKKLDAAHYLIINNNQVQIKKYWDIDLKANKFGGTIEQAAEIFLELFTNSIEKRLRSDVPVGSSLSGGLDSSSIVMLIDSLKGKELKQNTFSARFENFAKDEGKYIEEVVKKCRNVEVHYTWPDKEYFEEVFDKVAYHQDEPFGSASIIAQYAVMELAKKNNVTVLLDGQGADEYLGGYLDYYHTYLNQLFYSNNKLYSSEHKLYNDFHKQTLPFNHKGETFRMRVGRYRRKLLNKDLPYENAFATELRSSTTKLGLKELLRYADRNSMAHSREVRLPFLNHKLVEFSFSLADEFKINKGWTKFILRKSMDAILPESITWRVDKIGYEPPQAQWINSEKFSTDIRRSAKTFDMKVENLNNTTVFNENWRLLMASKFIN